MTAPAIRSPFAHIGSGKKVRSPHRLINLNTLFEKSMRAGDAVYMRPILGDILRTRQVISTIHLAGNHFQCIHGGRL